MRHLTYGGAPLGGGGNTMYMSSPSTAFAPYEQIYLFNTDGNPGTPDNMNCIGKVFTKGSADPWVSYSATGIVTFSGEHFDAGATALIHAVSGYTGDSAYVYAWHHAELRNWGVYDTGMSGGVFTAKAIYSGAGTFSALNLDHSGGFSAMFSLWTHASGVMSMSARMFLSGNQKPVALGVEQ